MGCCDSSPHDKRTSEINQQLQALQQESFSITRILLLGTGDSGKSTFLRQMKILHLGGFDSKERNKCAFILRQNVIDNFKLAISTSDILQKDQVFWDKCQTILEGTDELNEDVGALIEEAWTNNLSFQDFVTQQFCFRFSSSAPFLFSHAAQIAHPHFQPTDEDILYSRSKSTGIQEVEFSYRDTGSRVVLIDVGGQRSERRKWINCFADVTAIIYVAALDSYDLELSEDAHTNRLTESLTLFQELSSNPFLQGKPFMLFLNKKDVFKQKIKSSPLTRYFPDLPQEDSEDYERAMHFIEELYTNRFAQKKDNLKTFKTCALNKSNMAKVFKVVVECLMREMMRAHGLE